MPRATAGGPTHLGRAWVPPAQPSPVERGGGQRLQEGRPLGKGNAKHLLAVVLPLLHKKGNRSGFKSKNKIKNN